MSAIVLVSSSFIFLDARRNEMSLVIILYFFEETFDKYVYINSLVILLKLDCSLTSSLPNSYLYCDRYVSTQETQ